MTVPPARLFVAGTGPLPGVAGAQLSAYEPGGRRPRVLVALVVVLATLVGVVVTGLAGLGVSRLISDDDRRVVVSPSSESPSTPTRTSSAPRSPVPSPSQPQATPSPVSPTTRAPRPQDLRNATLEVPEGCRSLGTLDPSQGDHITFVDGQFVPRGDVGSPYIVQRQYHVIYSSAAPVTAVELSCGTGGTGYSSVVAVYDSSLSLLDYIDPIDPASSRDAVSVPIANSLLRDFQVDGDFIRLEFTGRVYLDETATFIGQDGAEDIESSILLSYRWVEGVFQRVDVQYR